MGGTIASTPAETGTEPTLSADALTAAIPEIDSFGLITVDEVVRKPSPELEFEDLETLQQRILSLASDVDAIVILHGTDTLEETAYFLDLTVDVSIPIVMTGAQRRFDEVSPDGPANVVDALRFATSEELSGVGGVYVAFDEELHAAADVTKAHTSRLDAFESPTSGPVAQASRNGVRFLRTGGSQTPVLPSANVTARVETVHSGISVDGTQVRRALADDVDGLVIAGTGLGNLTEPLASSVEDAIDRDVVTTIVSRCHAGDVAPVYGSAGGGQHLFEQGAILAGSLHAHKARIAVALACSATSNPGERWRLTREACAVSTQTTNGTSSQDAADSHKMDSE